MYKIDKTLVDNMNLNKSVIVITNTNTSPKPKPKDKIDISDALDEELPPKVKKKAQQLLHTAKTEADAIVAKAITEAENIKASAIEQGYQDGISGADEKLEEHLNSELGELRSLVMRLHAYERELLAEMQDSVLALSLEIAEKIVNIQLKRDDIVFVGIVKEAIARLKSDEKFALRVSRSEYNRFFKEDGGWLRQEIGCGSFEVIVDPDMAAGDCMVESDSKIIDAGIPLQMKKVKAALSGKAD